MTFPREIKSYMGEPRTDPLLRCIRVPFRPYLLPKGRTRCGKGFPPGSPSEQSVSEPSNMAACAHLQSSEGAKEETGTCQPYKTAK